MELVSRCIDSELVGYCLLSGDDVTCVDIVDSLLDVRWEKVEVVGQDVKDGWS